MLVRFAILELKPIPVWSYYYVSMAYMGPVQHNNTQHSHPCIPVQYGAVSMVTAPYWQVLQTMFVRHLFLKKEEFTYNKTLAPNKAI